MTDQKENPMYTKRAFLRLESGEIFPGYSWGFSEQKSTSGELVFSTGMVGYVESLTDPSFKNQMLVMTYPLIGNYGVPNSNELDDNGVLKYFESNKIHLNALIVSEFSKEFSHWNASQSIDKWLKDQCIPGMYGVDTRELTKIIREHGVVRAQIVYDNSIEVDYNWDSSNLVDKVSTKEIMTISSTKYLENNENGKKILLVDCGLKMNQIRCLLKFNVQLKIVPWNYPISEKEDFDALFISNGPGDPTHCGDLIKNIRNFIDKELIKPIESRRPLFGICLGHQIISLAIGAKTYKMKYGNRALNIPCQLVGSKRGIVTSQNHGYAVDADTLPHGWKQLFVNANDGSNEGIYCTFGPFYSVQFHPEAKPGPEDSEFLFQLFVENRMHEIYKNMTINIPENKVENKDNNKETKNEFKNRKKVLILGSGGLSIGQSGEFDYSGSQAIKAYREAGIHTVLINPNIATNQTSPGFADKVYFLPVTPEYVLRVIKVERPDCITVSFGGQTALNCGVKLYKDKVFERYGIEVLGSPIESVIDTEDRDRFKIRLDDIEEEAIESLIANNPDEAVTGAESIGYPVLVRAAYALGGLGSGFANNLEELNDLLKVAFSHSSQVIIDKSLWGWKELEYEVVRDRFDNCICVCNMENIDPLGVHTGESIVVAPSQTLDDTDFQMLRTSAIKVIRSLGVVGECNIQFALDPKSRQYYIIEVNARLSRSSALASKATGYPLAYVAARLSLGESLLDVENSITKNTCALFEPSMDYCVVKVPRWDLRKFPQVSIHLDSSMKSIGEAMGIGRKFEEAFQKALRMADDQGEGFTPGLMADDPDVLRQPTYQRMKVLATCLFKGSKYGYSIEECNSMSGIDKWFLQKMVNIINSYHEIQTFSTDNYPSDNVLILAKKLGMSDKLISKACESTETVIRNRRKELGLLPVVKQIDTVAAEFPCYTNYLYTTYSDVHVNKTMDKYLANSSDVSFNHQDGIIVLGSGVYRIGSSVEFDWCCVNAVRELRKLGYHTTMINCNPETVSTDYDEADQLYFDELSYESVMDIYDLENPANVILAMGGQVANNIAMQLHHSGVNVAGTSPEVIDIAENRYKFSRLLDQIEVQQPEWREFSTVDEASSWANQVGYPCLIRPSYVLSGAAMNVCYSDDDLATYLNCATQVSRDHPVVISKYITDAKEIEVDAVAANGQIYVMAISEHVENAGVHSGDSTLILPAVDVNLTTKRRIERVVRKIARSIDIKGPFNMQFMVKNDQVKVIECNLRVSRTFPFVSKTLKVNLIKVAIEAMISSDNPNYDVHSRIAEIDRKIDPHAIGVKVAKFSFSRLKKADFTLGVEMVSTGEVACYGNNRYEAYLKALQASDFKLPDAGCGILISLGTYRFKEDFIESAKNLVNMGYKLWGTRGTCDFLLENAIDIKEMRFDQTAVDTNSFEYLVEKGQIGLIINASRKGRVCTNENDRETMGYIIRRTAVDNSVPIITDIKCAKLLVKSLELFESNSRTIWTDTTVDCMTSFNTIKLPGLVDVHVHMREPGAEWKEDWKTGTASALAGGITTICAMPNTDPAIIGSDELNVVEKLSASKSYCDYGLYVGANSNNYNKLSGLADRAIALKMYLNNTYGPLLLENVGDWAKHIEAWPCDDRPLCVHAEGKTLSGVLHVANIYGKRIHVCHVARRDEIEIIKMSKKIGMKVTCEVAPHHLFMNVEDLKKMGSCGDVKPPLMTTDDVQALWDNMDVIDCFATDHAPHTWEEKSVSEHVPPGFPGLETVLPLLLTAVNEGRLTINQIVEKYHTNPIKIFHLENVIDNDNTYIEVDLDKEWTIPMKPRFSKAGWTPFAGRKVVGMVRRVVLRNKVVYVDGQILAKPGYGRNLGLLTGVSRVKSKVNDYSSSDGDGNVRALTESIDNVLHSKNELEERLVASMKSWKNRSLFSVEELDKFDLRVMFQRADQLRAIDSRDLVRRLESKIVGMIFYEPSTRTKCSFSAAVQRMGGKIIETSVDTSSVKKGESFSDFVKCIKSYTDLVVIRSSQDIDLMSLKGDADRSHGERHVPVINAGNGSHEHPTQALLDIYTIRQERGTVNGLKIALVGDLENGRTVHSLAKLLANYDVELKYVSPGGLGGMPREIIEYVRERGVTQTVHESLDDIIGEVDVLYLTRIQLERMSEEARENFEDYRVTPKNLTKAKSNLVVMHPLPRVDEISKEIDNDPRAAYFRQMENGMWLRMALLDLILGQ